MGIQPPSRRHPSLASSKSRLFVLKTHTFTVKMSSQIQALQKQVDQLRQEASIQRIPVSKAIEDLVTFMNQQSTTDVLVVGISQSENPFRDQKGCIIL